MLTHLHHHHSSAQHTHTHKQFPSSIMSPSINSIWHNNSCIFTKLNGKEFVSHDHDLLPSKIETFPLICVAHSLIAESKCCLVCGDRSPEESQRRTENLLDEIVIISDPFRPSFFVHRYCDEEWSWLVFCSLSFLCTQVSRRARVPFHYKWIYHFMV